MIGKVVNQVLMNGLAIVWCYKHLHLLSKLAIWVCSRDTREWGMETPFWKARSRNSAAGWHARMSSRLAGKGACACSRQVSNIRLRPSPQGGHRARRMKQCQYDQNEPRPRDQNAQRRSFATTCA